LTSANDKRIYSPSGRGRPPFEHDGNKRGGGRGGDKSLRQCGEDGFYPNWGGKRFSRKKKGRGGGGAFVHE